MNKKINMLMIILLAMALVCPIDSIAKGGGGGGRSSSSGSSGRSYSAPSRSYSAPSTPSRSYSSPSYSAPSAPQRSYSPPASYPSKSYSAPASSPSRTYSAPSTSSPSKSAPAIRTNSNYDSGASRAQRTEQSRQNYIRANTPKDYVRSNPTVTRDIGSRTVYETRTIRSNNVYHVYVNRPVPVYYQTHYNDPFNNALFFMYLADQSRATQDAWYYNHWRELDEARRQQLVQHDAQLEARLRALEAQGVKPDSNYAPPGLDKDLQYDDATVVAAVKQNQSSGFWSAVGTFFKWVIILGLLWLLFYFIFIRRS